MGVRDFDPTQLDYDMRGILDQAGVTFTMAGTVITGVWGISREGFDPFEDQRREGKRHTIFFLTSQLPSSPQISQTLVRSAVTFYVEQLRFDAEGTGCEMDVCKSI